MLKGRGRDPKAAVPPTPTMSIRSVTRLSKPEPDYEVVEFPTEQYVNAKLQPPPPPPRPPTGHPFEAGASCGLCGGGGARVRCAECGRRALCASCDDMYHRHPKRRHHQRQALSLSQLREERPPLPPKTGPPVPPPRKHKVAGDRSSGSPRLPTLDQRRMTLNSMPPNEMSASHIPLAPVSNPNHFTAQRSQPPALSTHLQMNIASNSHLGHLGSMSYQSETMHHTQAPVAPTLKQSNSLGLVPNPWGRQRGSLPGFIPPNTGLPLPVEPWEIPEGTHSTQSWNRPLRRGTSVMELGIGPPQTNPNCAGCAHCLGQPWRYGSCASLDHTWTNTWAPNCCVPPHPQHTSRLPLHHQVHHHIPQAYRKAESRAVSRATSRADSRAPSPATSTRSRTSRRPKHRTPSPQPLPSSDADSENEEESDHKAAKQETEEDLLGPPPSPPEASWQCEHCTFVNEPGVRVCVVCCRTPTISPRIINTASIKNGMKELKLYDNRSPAIDRNTTEEIVSKRGQEKSKTKIQNARTSTACGPSPPRDEKVVRKSVNRLATPARDEPSHNCQMKQEVAVGPSPPKETETRKNSNQTQLSTAMKTAHPNSIPEDKPMRRSVSVGPSPPREQIIQKSHVQATINNQKKSIGTSPPRKTFIDTPASVFSSTSSRVNISNTGTSPPPQSISTQTYDVTNTAREWERASSVLRSRARRRFREEGRRERSHSRHSLSSDTRESERSVRTSGGGNLGPGRWEWREPRDSSPGGEWSGSERHRSSQLSRRASHLDLRRTRSSRRSSAYGSEAPSPEPFTENRAVSLEVLAGVGARRETERGLELARLMGEAEKLGFSAAEVHAALAQNPAAPLTWLRERWPSLCAGVRAAAVRLVPEAVISERDARTALARHRGAMWPAVTDCVEKWRRQRNTIGLENEGRLRGHVWGSPTGIEDDAAPPTDHSHRMRAEESSDEFEFTARNIQDDDWMYLPLENNKFEDFFLQKAQVDTSIVENEDIAFKLKTLLIQAGIPNINEQLLLKGLLANHNNIPTEEDTNVQNPTNFNIKQNSNDFVQSENDFIEAYNALTRLSPLPIINKLNNVVDSHDHISNNHNSDIGINEKKQCLNSINIVSNTNNMKQKGSNIQRPEADNLKINKDIKTQPSTLETGHGSQKITITRSKIKKLKEPNNSVNVKVIQPIKNKSETYNSDSQEDEKADNLNEIVDNTQKLIQQMKKELNSDIRSLDSRSNTKSESDTLSSEKESSYTDTENETEDISSEDNENEISNTKDENEAHRRTIKRTSSEDNEQFEEAIDHLEVQISNLDEHNFNNLEHDFKQSNIEILNSIAKKLQEEQSLSVQTHVTRISQNVQQDVNNNLYNTVNSFEEIYDELTDAKSNIIKESSLLRVINNSDQNVPLKERKTLYKKEDIMFINYFPPSAATILLSKIEHPLIQATLDVAILDTNNSINKNENKIQEELLDNIDNFIVESKTISIPNIHEDFKIPADNTSVDIDKDDVSSQSQSTNLDTENDVSKIEDAETDEITMNQNISKINQQGNEEENDDKLYNSVEINTTKTDDIESLESIEIIRNKKKNSTFNKGFFNKSNIPKLVKALQNNKLKIEKTPLKVLGSKVPVRRTSLKHYPAPAPPKQFDKIQNGHVKQLQTKLFNNKSQNITNISTEIEVKPSTSTNSILTKKKPAPLPPAASEHNQQSSPKHVTEKEIENKNNYFRETCRTEDEWTESDSEEFKMPFTKQNNDPELTPFSPPVPITVRRVSGQLIDLATIRLPEGSPERQARMLLAEGATENWIQAQLAVELISRGINSQSALLAALECTDLNSALTYLHQDCELCASRLPEYEMVSMLRCTHRCCRECARHYFTVQITERNIADCVCPYCKEPELENRPEDDWLEYFAHLDILLKTLLNTDVHELFQRKLRDRTLARDPNFKWCVECSSGFFVHPKQKKLRCPECKSVSCASCRKPWSSNHEGITCDQYTKWLEDNDPERSVAAVHQHLRENGLECPRCHFKYSLSRGGCMHFTCTQCKYEFCYGCGKPFMMGARCGLSEYCAKLGLHAHHPRNCLFYLRDKEPHELQTLLQMNNVTYETKASEGGAGRCPIQLQRETPTGLVDGACGSDASPNHAGLCKNHYLEYLSRLVRSQHIDPLPILGVDDLETLVRRAALRLPPRPYGTLEGLYKRGLIEIVREKIPLD